MDGLTLSPATVSLPAAVRRVAAAGVGLIVFAAGRQALACPVCFSAKNEANQIAFLVTTALLTFAPLLMIGGLIWWLRRRTHDEELPGRTHAPDAGVESGATGLVTLAAAGIGAMIRLIRRSAQSRRTASREPVATVSTNRVPATGRVDAT